MFVINFLVIYFLLSWMPSLFREAGQSTSNALLAAALFNLGGMAGALSIGWITDRLSKIWRGGSGPVAAYAVVMAGYTLGALFIGVVAVVLNNAMLLLVATCIVGFGMSGSSAGIIAIAASIYPVAARATGVGWALGVGRLGSIVGPSLGAVMMATGMPARSIFLLTVAPTLLAVLVLGVLLMRGRRSRAGAVAAQTATVSAG